MTAFEYFSWRTLDRKDAASGHDAHLAHLRQVDAEGAAAGHSAENKASEQLSARIANAAARRTKRVGKLQSSED